MDSIFKAEHQRKKSKAKPETLEVSEIIAKYMTSNFDESIINYARIHPNDPSAN
jgi:hypothetical protein